MSSGTLAPGAWSGLESLRGDIERSLRRSCRDANELDDLVQETFIRAARFRGSLQSPARLRSWVLRIAWNVLRDHVRRQQRFRLSDVSEEFLHEVEGREAAPGELPDQRLVVGQRQVERSDLAELLTDVLPDLREDERTLLAAYYGEESGCALAGAKIGISAERVKMRLYRLRKRLRRQLEQRSGMQSHVTLRGREVMA